MNQKIRGLGTTEKLHWMINKVMPFNFYLAMTLNGKIEKAILTEALKALQVRHPLLNVSIEKKGWWGANYRYNVNSPVEISEKKVRRDEIDLILEQELNQPFNIKEAPLVRCHLLHHDNRSTVIATFCHIIADGLSSVIFQKNLLEYIDTIQSGKEVSVQPGTVKKPLEKYFPVSYKSIFGIVKFVSAVKNMGKKEKAMGKPIMPIPDGNNKEGKPRIQLISRKIKKEALIKIVEKSRTNGTTINHLLIAAYIMATIKVRNIKESSAFYFSTDVDLRDLLCADLSNSIGIYSSAISGQLIADFGSNIWQLATIIKSEFNESMESKEAFILPPYFYKILNAIIALTGSDLLGKKIYTKMFKDAATRWPISNLGKVDINASGNKLKAESITFACSWFKIHFYVVTSNDVLTVNLVGSNEFYSRDLLNNFADEVINILNEQIEI